MVPCMEHLEAGPWQSLPLFPGRSPLVRGERLGARLMSHQGYNSRHLHSSTVCSWSVHLRCHGALLNCLSPLFQLWVHCGQCWPVLACRTGWVGGAGKKVDTMDGVREDVWNSSFIVILLPLPKTGQSKSIYYIISTNSYTPHFQENKWSLTYSNQFIQAKMKLVF